MSAAVRSLSPQVLDKLSKLLLMLSSEADGERANAAAMIGQLLSANGCDWHDLAALVNHGEASASPTSSWQRTDGPANLQRGQLLELLDVIEERSPFLRIKSAEFLSSLRDRARVFPIVRLSAKQWKWVQDLIEQTGI
jgi:hypothetical protein